MSLKSWLRGALGTVTSGTSELGRAERVSALLPGGADYVTVGVFQVLPDALAFVGGRPGEGPYRRQFGATPTAESRGVESGLLVLAGGRLRVLADDGERWAADVADITDLDAHRFSGFVVILRDRSGVAVSQQVPVEASPSGSWRTAGRVLNAFSGWDDVLSPHGARVHF